MMRLTVAMLAVLAMANVAGAQQVWFTATPLTNATVHVQGAPGVSTVLGATVPGASSSWRIDVWIYTGGEGGLIQYDIALETPLTSTVASDPVWLPPPGWDIDCASVGYGWNLLRYAASTHGTGLYTFVGLKVAEFTLTQSVPPPLPPIDISGGCDAYGWAYYEHDPWDFPLVQFGADWVLGSPDSWTMAPVIRILLAVPPTGACCQPDGTCAVTYAVNCTGVWLGDDTTCSPNPCLFAKGDVNCDQAVNTDDIPYFVAALIGGYTGCDITLADMNGDNLEDGTDIQGFVDALLPP